MKKRVSPFLVVGFVFLIVGGVLSIVFRFINVDWDSSLLTICLNVLAIILLIIGIIQTAKNQKIKGE